MQEHEGWLNIAKSDLLAAKALLKLEFFSQVMYSCQQSAEKALKGYLAFKNQEILKTHDLTKLLKTCSTFNSNFDDLYESAKHLNPYSTRFRYPTEFDLPDLNDTELAIKYAENIFKFVSKKIAESSTGQTNLFT